MLEKIRPLEELKVHCQGCLIPTMLRAAADKDRSLEDGDFYCIGAINYPISKRAEDWLAGLAAEAVRTSGPGMDLINFILDNDIPLRQQKIMRADSSGQFYELKTPLTITVKKSLLGSKSITTDHLLTVVFRQQIMDHNLIELILLFSGGYFRDDHKPAEGESQVGVSMKVGDYQIWKVLNLKDSKDDDQCIYQLKNFMRALYVALIGGHEVIIIP